MSGHGAVPPPPPPTPAQRGTSRGPVPDEPPVVRGFLDEPVTMHELPARAGDARGFFRRGRDVIFGTERRIGVWTLPLFLIMGLLGATLSGGLALLYYGQQVRDLERTTSRARAQLDEVAEDLGKTAEEARKEIQDEARSVKEAVSRKPPIASPNEAGIYAVAARHAGGEVRVGSGFAIFSDSNETYMVTSYSTVESDDGFAVRTADVYLPGGTVTATVHNYDRDLDVATLRLRGGPVPVPEWRPGEQGLTRGDAVYVAGIAGPSTPTIVSGTIAGFSSATIVSDIALNAFLAGAPLLDASGKVMGIASLGYHPFGPVEGDLEYAVPIRLICKRLVRCTRSDLQAGQLGDEGGSGAVRRPPPSQEREATSSPTPTSSPPPPTEPTPTPTP
jgi:S1-C subfamily serine protease